MMLPPPAALVQALGWCLVHFLWQALLVGAAYALARPVLPRGNARYGAAMLALAALALVPAWTFWREWQLVAQPLAPAVVPVAGAATATTAGSSPWDFSLWPHLALPWAVLAWALGVVLLASRAARQWWHLRAIVRAAAALPLWQTRARELGARLGLRHAVRVLASVRMATPTLVGWLRPVVVMPLAVLATLPPAQVDLILAHELAHLRRLDHLANLFQVVLEIVFFYHPVVHWISRDARNERELCCDALALRVSGGARRDFIAALAGLEEFRSSHADLALAASGGVLVERAWFMAGRMPAPRPRIGGALLALGVVGVAAVLLAFWQWRTRQDALPAPAPVVPARIAPPLAWVAAPPVRPRLALPALRVTAAPAAPTVARAAAAQPALTVVDLSNALPVLPQLAVAQSPPPVTRANAVAAPAPLLVPLRVVAPVYPPRALAAGLHGAVTVAFALDAAGRPRALAVVSASPAGVFDAAALHALAQWRFRPATPSARTYRQTFSFTPADARGGDVVAADAGCQYVTGSHICRDPGTGEPRPRLAAPARP